MATFLAHIRVHSGREQEFEQIAAELARGTHEHEPGVRYEYWRAAEPSSYYAVASFDSFDGFLTHQTSDHHESAGPALRDVIESMRLEWLDPVPGTNEAAVTDVGPLSDGASALAASYHERFSGDVVADWWPARPA